MDMWKKHTQEERVVQRKSPAPWLSHSPCVKRQQHVFIKQNLFRSICYVGKKHVSTFLQLNDIKGEKQLLRQSSCDFIYSVRESYHPPQPSQAQSKPGR